jgi:xylulokinase
MEGVTFETREIIEQMITNGVQIDTIILSGGASKSASGIRFRLIFTENP